MHHGGLEAKPEEREVQKKEIIERNIRYGGKLLSEINTEEKTFYMTFKADKVVRPKKRMFLVWDKNSNDCLLYTSLPHADECGTAAGPAVRLLCAAGGGQHGQHF